MEKAQGWSCPDFSRDASSLKTYVKFPQFYTLAKGHYFQIIFHSHPSISLYKYQYMASHLDKIFAKSWLWGHFLLPLTLKILNNNSHLITQQRQLFFPRMDHFCTKVAGLCCRLCYLGPFTLNSINKLKNQNVLFWATFPLTLGLFSEWFHFLEFMSIKQLRYKDPHWANKRKNIQLSVPHCNV